MGASVSDEELRELIAEVDINQNATIEEEEFLQVCVHVCLSVSVSVLPYSPSLSLFSIISHPPSQTHPPTIDDECPEDGRGCQLKDGKYCSKKKRK